MEKLFITATWQSSGDAVNDILNDNRFSGFIDSIDGVTKIVNTGSTMFITFVAFLIICVAMWRYVTAWAYFTYSKFWDQVHVAHDEVRDMGWGERVGKLTNTAEMKKVNTGSIKKLLMQILPDIKDMVDIDDETDPKTSMMKATGLMIGTVMIGVFIYNGYFRDTTIVVSKFGSEMFNRTVNNIDPVAVFDRLMATTGTPDFATDNSLTTEGKRINTIAHSVYKTVISSYPDITSAETKATLAASIENLVTSMASSITEINDDRWKMSSDFSAHVGTSPISYSENAEGTQKSYPISIPVSSLNIDSTHNVGVDMYIIGIVNMTKGQTKDVIATYYDLTMTANIQIGTDTSGKVTWTFSDPSDLISVASASGGSVTFNGTTYNFKLSKGVMTFTSGAPTSYSQSMVISGVKYKAGSSVHTVKNIIPVNVGSAGSLSFTSATIGATTFSYGTEIKTSTTEDK